MARQTRVTEDKAKRLFELGTAAVQGDSLATIALTNIVNAMDVGTAREYVVAGFMLAGELTHETNLVRVAEREENRP